MTRIGIRTASRSSAGAFLLLVLALLAIRACGDRERPGPGPAKVESLPLPAKAGLFVVGRDLGMLRPCGCSKPLLGGIVRRGAFFATVDPEIRAASTIVAVGGMIHGGGRQQELKLEAFLDSLAELGAAVILPAEEDLLVGSRFWTELLFDRPATAPPLVAGNLKVDGVPLFATETLIELGGHELVVTSWLWPESGILSEPGVTLDPRPDLDPLRALLVAADGKARDLIVYSSAPESVARAWLREEGLLERANRVLLLLGGASDLPIVLAGEEGYLAAEVGQKGRDVARLDWPGADGLESFNLVEAYGGHEAQQAILERYRAAVRAEQLLLQTPKFEPAEGGYAGHEACASCHEEAYAVWKDSRHAHAFATLKRVGDDEDPECVRCHVVDFDRLGGFDPVSVEPVDVQCEACHGPSAEHADDPTRPTPRGKMDDYGCRSCHDLANSPRYDFEIYWPKISHGR